MCDVHRLYSVFLVSECPCPFALMGKGTHYQLPDSMVKNRLFSVN